MEILTGKAEYEILFFFVLQHDSADSDDECKYYSKQKTKEYSSKCTQTWLIVGC